MTAASAGPSWRALLWAAPYLALGIVDHLYAGAFVGTLWLYWLDHFVEYVVLGLAVLWLILRATGWRLRDLGLAWPEGDAKRLRLLGLSLAGIAALLLFSPASEAITDWLGIPAQVPEEQFDYAQVFPEQWHLRVLVIGYVCAVSSFFEETFYRGVLWRAIVGDGGGHARKAGYVVFSSVIFGVTHSEQGLYGVVSTGIWGAFGALLLLKWRNLWPLILGHAATNLFEFLPMLAPEAADGDALADISRGSDLPTAMLPA